MKKHFIAYALFDPEIVKNIDFNEHEKNKYIHQQMLSYGYVHEQKNAYQYMQINNNYRLLFDYNQSNLEEEIFNHFDKKLQYDINLCKSRGVSIEKYSGIQYTKDTKLFDTFYDLFLETSERKHFGIKKENFYKQMLYNLKDYSYIYLAKYNYEIDYQNTNKLIIDTKNKIKELEESNNKKSNNKIKELTENIASYQKRLESIDQYKNANPYIGAAYFILIGEQSYYLLGANSKELRFTKPTSLLVWEMIRDSIKNKVISYNLGGSLTFKTDKIEDDPMYNVYNFKKQLSGELVEYYGDYYLINNKKIYQFWEKKNRLLKRLNSRF
jgi:lipid II:glycine glycyltransferase (peptidoglycan interpeptide bridge formation enzyme)